MDLILALAFTSHFGLAGDYNEVHPHAQLRFNNGIVAGTYLNSEGTGSAYAGYRFEQGAAFLELGAVTGYEAIAVAPYLRVGFDITDNIEIFAAPAFEVKPDDALGVVFGVSFQY